MFATVGPNGEKRNRFRRLTRAQIVPLPVAEVFSFFVDEKNLEVITPAWLRFRVVGKSTPTIQAGTLIDYRLRIRGVPLTWQSIIEEWVPNQRFVDRQIVGPYARWHHTHTFTPTADGGTLVSDKVEYQIPGGVIGDFLLGRFIAKDLDRIFEYRRQAVEKLFAAAEI